MEARVIDHTTGQAARKRVRASRAGVGAMGDASGAAEARIYSLSRSYLGGAKFWQRPPGNKIDVHAAIVKGIPYGALVFLVSQAKNLDEGDVARVLGISTRTLRRQTEAPNKPMPADLASKAWLFAETLAKATEVFGGKQEAEHWLSTEAIGLNRQRPIDLMQTVQGAELVNDFLARMEYGVYS